MSVFFNSKRAATALIFFGLFFLLLKPVNAQNLDGLYIGFHGGWIHSQTNAELESFDAGAAANVFGGNNIPREIDNDTDGFLGGIQAGVSKQAGFFMMGLEGDLSFTGIDEQTTVSLPGGGAAAGSPSATTISTEMDWLATLRIWAGMRTAPNLFLYLTGGAAFADVDHTMTLNFNPLANGSFRGADNAIDVGWTVGGGAEWTVGGGWSIKTEYLYYDLQNTSVAIRDPNIANSDLTYEFENIGHIARVGLNYSFSQGLPGPLK